MALKCPECGTMAHARTSSYEAPSVKRSWYQCQNLECSCTFTALESVDTIIMKPHKPVPSEPESQDDSPHVSRRRWAATVRPVPLKTVMHNKMGRNLI